MAARQDEPEHVPARTADEHTALAAHLRAHARAIGFSFRIYGIALACVLAPGVALLIATREAVAYLVGHRAVAGITSLDAAVFEAALLHSVAACLAPLVMLAGLLRFVLDRRAFNAHANAAIEVGLRHGGFERPVDDDTLAGRLGAFRAFMRTVSVAMPLIGIALGVVLCTAASWGWAGALSPQDVFTSASLEALSCPPDFTDHLIHWSSTLANFVLLGAPESFGWPLSPIQLRSDAYLLLAMGWSLSLALIWMVAEYLSFAFNWAADPQAASLNALIANTEVYVRDKWRAQAAAAEVSQPDDRVEVAGAVEQAAPSANRMSDEDLLAIVPRTVWLRLLLPAAGRGLLLGGAVFALGLAVIALCAFLLLLPIWLAVPQLSQLDVLTVAGLTIVPLYLLSELVFRLADRGRFERKIAELFGAIGLVSRPEADESDEQRLNALLHGQIAVMVIRAMLVSFLAVGLMVQCLYLAIVTRSVLTVWPSLALFSGPTAHDQDLGAIALYWLDMPLDILLLGAPDLFGFRLSSLTANSGNLAFVSAAFVYKVFIAAEAIALLFAIWNTRAEACREKNRAMLQDLESSATSQSAPESV